MKKVKCFIFDQDGTFYPEDSKLTDELRRKTKRWLMKRLSLKINEVEELYKKLPKKYPNALEGFISLGLTIRDYHKNVFDTVDPSKYLSKDEKLISTLKKLGGEKFVVTFSSKRYSESLQKTLGIYNIIKKTYSSIDFLPETSKIFIYNYIKKIKKLKKEEICIVGNNLEVDVLPALNEGYKTILIDNHAKRINFFS